MANIKISELNSLSKKDYEDLLPIVDVSANETKKISIEELVDNNVNLIAVSSTAPLECSTGDKYYNTTTNLIYTATATDTWGETGEEAIKGITYVLFDDQSTYAYNGITLIKVGGVSGGVTNNYSTSTTESYSCDYSNGMFTPIGVVNAYAGNTAPTNWLICDGSEVSRTIYEELFNIIGTTYGSGDGSTTFNLPNLKGKIPVGYDSLQTEFDTLGKTGGEKTHTLTTQEMPNHKHEGIYWLGASNRPLSLNTGSNANGYKVNWEGSADDNKVHTGFAGSGQAHNNLQPYIALNYIIKAK